ADAAGQQPQWTVEEEFKKPGKPLILPAEQAQRIGLVQHVVDGLPDVYAVYGLDPARVHVARGDWLDALVEFLIHPMVSVVLVMVGLTCLILELKMPGVTLPGIVAALCFLLFFWAHSQLAGS